MRIAPSPSRVRVGSHRVRHVLSLCESMSPAPKQFALFTSGASRTVAVRINERCAKAVRLVHTGCVTRGVPVRILGAAHHALWNETHGRCVARRTPCSQWVRQALRLCTNQRALRLKRQARFRLGALDTNVVVSSVATVLGRNARLRRFHIG